MHTKSERQVALEVALDEISQQRAALAEKARTLRQELNTLLEEEHLDHWGVTAEQYLQAKHEAYPERETRSRLDAVTARRLYHLGIASDPRKLDSVREEHTRKAEELDSLADDLMATLTILTDRRQPLARVLNRIRRANGKAAREVQQATAQVAQSAVRGKKG